jgi:hypothetical protein
MKSNFQVLVNEIKSMTEIISIFKEELKYHNATSQERNSNSTYTGTPSTNSPYCSKHSELENQLKDTSSELSSVKLITEILNEEIKVLKQTSHNDSTSSSPWLNVKSSHPRRPSTIQPPKEVHITHGIPVACQYALPVANRYDALANRHDSQEPRDTTVSTKFEHSEKLGPDNSPQARQRSS